MSGNHLLPIYYNTSRLTPKRKKKRVSEKELRLIQEHEKFILKMGYKKRSEEISEDYGVRKTDSDSEYLSKGLESLPRKKSETNSEWFCDYWSSV